MVDVLFIGVWIRFGARLGWVAATALLVAYLLNRFALLTLDPGAAVVPGGLFR